MQLNVNGMHLMFVWFIFTVKCNFVLTYFDIHTGNMYFESNTLTMVIIIFRDLLGVSTSVTWTQ